MLNQSVTPSGINYNLNSDLQGLTPLQCLDALISYCGRVGMRVILTRDSCLPENAWNENFWFIPNDAYFTAQRFVDDWILLAKRYRGHIEHLLYLL